VEGGGRMSGRKKKRFVAAVAGPDKEATWAENDWREMGDSEAFPLTGRNVMRYVRSSQAKQSKSRPARGRRQSNAGHGYTRPGPRFRIE
jgi:hypothetical protein